MAVVPEELRPAIAEQLAALVGGSLPDLLVWVRQYGQDGASLIQQPTAIWTHSRTSVTPVIGGGWVVVLPLWTTEESPSDLSAEILVTSEGRATIHDVHVL